MALTADQKRTLLASATKIGAPMLLKYVQAGDVTIDELKQAGVDDGKISYIEEQIKSMPNPDEQRDWETIETCQRENRPDLTNRLKMYVSRWDAMNPAQNHVAEAKALLATLPDPTEQAEWAAIVPILHIHDLTLLKRLESYIVKWENVRPAQNHVDEAVALRTDIIRDVEETDWQKVDTNSKISLIGHLKKYPGTSHFSEIDEYYWAIVQREKNNNIAVYKRELSSYIMEFSSKNGAHVDEAHDIIKALDEWDRVRSSRDIFDVYKYIKEHPESPFISEAQALYYELQAAELELMKKEKTKYSVGCLRQLLEYGIFESYQLIDDGIITQDIIDRMNAGGVGDDHSDLLYAIQQIKEDTPFCEPNATDVYFFGIPGTGKSCVLMGLTSSPELNVDFANIGGVYAQELQNYTNEGRALLPTPGDFVATMKADIRSTRNRDVKHNINLIEMSGEEFAKKIAADPTGVVNFDDMGSGTVELLRNNNKKVFFIIIDPTVTEVRFTYEETITDANGNTSVRLRNKRVVQSQALQRLVNIFQRPENLEYMKKVDAIHFIMTKADMLETHGFGREEKALEIFNKNYIGALRNLKSLCTQVGINVTTNHCPRLYTFSLGSFYVGNYYDYKEDDSNTLIDVIRSITFGTREANFLDKVKEFMNKPRI